MLEVVELGISGSKSQAKASDPPLLKENKTPQPASKRVRDAAESLLNLVLEEVKKNISNFLVLSVIQLNLPEKGGFFPIILWRRVCFNIDGRVVINEALF